VWNKVNGAALKGGREREDIEVEQSVEELQAQMKGLATIMQELATTTVIKKASYVDVLLTGV
jgi:hypothetical protein